MQLGGQYRATDRVKLRLGYALAQNPINPAVGTRIGPIEVPGGIPAVKYLQSQFAVINEHRIAGGVGVTDFMMRGLDLDAFAGGMLPAGESLGSSTYVAVESYWIGLGLTWHFDRSPRPRAAGT